MNLDAMTLTPAQRASIERVDGPLLLCAGAGSGKTFTLQNRIAYALSPQSESGVTSIEEILAITFTRKAAAEIKDRVRSALRSEGMMDEALRADAAWISTIHSMCDRILREHALEMGMNPDFETLDDVQAADLRRSAFSNVLARSRKAGDGKYDALFKEYGVNEHSDYSVPGMVNSILDQAAMLTDGLDAISLGPVDKACPSAVAKEVLLAYAGVLDSSPSPKVKADAQRGYDLINEYMASPESADSSDWRALHEVLAEMPKPGASGKAKEAAKAAQAALTKARIEVCHGVAIPLAKDLLDLVRAVWEEYELLKLRMGAIDQDGLLRLTLKALSEHPDIAQMYRNKFKLVMVDEFQDTNQLQIDLIRCICGDDLQTLCTVGDSQQSIYRFRGADVNVYLDHKKEMHSERVGAVCKQLDANFRSHADVLALVRKVCGQEGFFAEEFLDLTTGRKEKTGPDAKYQGDGPRIHMQVTEFASSGGTAKTEGAVAVEAEHIAKWFAQLRDQGHSASDMVILMGSTTHASAYAQALRKQGFDCMLTGGSGFYEMPEVRLVNCLLKVLANPADTQALFAVLSGEMMALSADDLVWLATRLPEENALQGSAKRQDIHRRLLGQLPEEASERLRFAATILMRAWNSLGVLPPSSIVQNVLEDSGWLSRLAAKGPEGDAVAYNLIKAVRIVREIEAGSDMGMARVARKFAQMMGNKDKMGALMGGQNKAVRIMTAHSSKGLEFPFVAVTHCYDTDEKSSTLELVVFGNKVHMALSLPDKLGVGSNENKAFMAELAAEEETQGLTPAEHAVRTSSMAEYKVDLLMHRQKEALLEKRRLFYVAATRASEALYVACVQKVNKGGVEPKEVKADIYTGLFAGGEGWYPGESCQVEYGGSQPLQFTFLNADQLYQEDDADESVRPVMAYPVLRERPELRTVPVKPQVADVFSYSSIEEYDAAALGVKPGGFGAPDVGKATSFGSAMHCLGQLAVLSGPTSARADVERVALTHGVADVERLRAALECWLESDVCARAYAYDRLVPELSFCVSMGQEGCEVDLFLEGDMDLYCANEDGSVLIVDYKTGHNEAETPEILGLKHALQARCYAYAALLQGASRVCLEFVHVERGDGGMSGQPLVTSYEFAGEDVEDLKASILSAYRAAVAC